MTNKKKLKELWNTHKGIMREEILDEIIIKIYTMFSYDNLEEPPFTHGIRVSKLFYYSNITESKIKSLLSKYDGIIVSKITAECLKELGYNKKIYITGRKFYKNNEFLGVRELCIL